MGEAPTPMLTREELLRIVDAFRALGEASAAGDLDRVVRGMMRVAAEATESDGAAIYLLDEERGDLVIAGTHPPVPELESELRRLPLRSTMTGGHVLQMAAAAYHVYELGRASEALAAAGFVEAAIVPLHVQGRPAGALHLGRRTARPFLAGELRFAETLASQVAIHVENARLYAETRRRFEDMRLLLDVGRAITGSLELERILVTSAESLGRMVGASNSFVLLLDEEGQVLRGVAASPSSSSAERLEIRLDATSAAARCVRTRSPVVIEDTSKTDQVNRALVERFGEKSLLALPLLVRERAMGALVIDDTNAPRRWTRAEIERAEMIAHQVAVAVTNARLFEVLRRSYAELEHAQNELVKRERLAALGNLAATLAHEVRNPLGVLFNSLGTLEKLVEPRGDTGVLLRIMREESERLNQLVGDLLDFARPNEPAFRRESLGDVVQGALEAVANEAAAVGVRVETEIACDLPLVALDARMMRRAVLNLALNGIQAMDRGGTLVVRAIAEPGEGAIFARLDVADTGVGIEPEHIERVFDPFFTTKPKGTGLGLAVVRSTVDAHHGTLEVRSTPGAGTTFSLRLPLERSRATPAAW